MAQVYVFDEAKQKPSRISNFMVGCLIAIIGVIMGIILALNVIVRWIQLDTPAHQSSNGVIFDE